jgi:hypothetical protein
MDPNCDLICGVNLRSTQGPATPPLRSPVIEQGTSNSWKDTMEGEVLDSACLITRGVNPVSSRTGTLGHV